MRQGLHTGEECQVLVNVPKSLQIPPKINLEIKTELTLHHHPRKNQR